MENLNELLTLTGLNKWLKTTSESYSDKEIAELAKRIYNETVKYKISENADYDIFFKKFNLYIKTVKNDGNFVLGLYKNELGSMKFKGIVDKNTVYGPGFLKSVANRPETKQNPPVKWDITSSFTLGVRIDPEQFINAESDIRGSFEYNTFSIGDGYNLPVGYYRISNTFTPEDLDNYLIKTNTEYVKVQYPGFMWTNVKNTYVYGEFSSSMVPYITGSFVDKYQQEIEGENELNLTDLDTEDTYYSVGTYYIYDYFTPTDTETYDILTGSKKITVNKFTPTVTWENIEDEYTYGNFTCSTFTNVTASYTDYNGNDITGTHNYSIVPNPFINPQIECLADVGTYTIYDYFTPDNTDNYNIVTASKNVRVKVAVPYVQWITDMTPYRQDPETFDGTFTIPADFYDNNRITAHVSETDDTGLEGTITYLPEVGTTLTFNTGSTLFMLSASFIPKSNNFSYVANYGTEVELIVSDEEPSEAK